MDPLRDDARLRELLVEADRLLAALNHPDPSSRADVMQALDATHRDLGRRVHDLWLETAGNLAPPTEAAPIPELDSLEDAGGEVDADWVAALQDLLALLGPPLESDTPTAIAVEAARVQWASRRLVERWNRFPQPIQLALLGLVGARARYVQDQLPIDVGARRALRRLDDYRRDAGLATVVSLQDDGAPESGAWPNDALQWWDMLVRGIQAS